MPVPFLKKVCHARTFALLLFAAILALAGCRYREATQPYWKSAREDVYRSALQVIEKHEEELRRGLKRHVLPRGSRRFRHLALTFDDGPHPQYTMEILKILDRYKVKATFFLVGEMARLHPDLVKAEAGGGHCLANHTFHHVNLTRIPQDMVATEIKACGKVIKGITGRAPRFFRPPGGDYNERVLEIAEALGYVTVLWTDDPGDYASPGTRRIEADVFEDVSNGGIILLHDGVQQTVEALPLIIRRLQVKGFEFVSLEQMMSERGGFQKGESKVSVCPSRRRVRSQVLTRGEFVPSLLHSIFIR